MKGCAVTFALTAISTFTTFAQLSFDAPVTLGAINSDKVTEASGIAVSAANAGVFWTHNDGPRDHVYAFRMDGALLADFDFAKNPDDIEDIAVGPGPVSGVYYIYIGDIGSNDANRDVVRIYRVAEPQVDTAWASDPVSRTIDSGVDTCSLKYPDGKYDAEALLVDPAGKMLYIVTKQSDQARIYEIALSRIEDNKTHPLTFVFAIDFPNVNGGAVSADGSLIALRREDVAYCWTRIPANRFAMQSAARPSRFQLLALL